VFLFAFFPAFVGLLSGISAAPDYATGKALVLSAAFAAASVAVKATLDFLTKGVSPAPSVGILPASVKR
jgi:hypothetical protein